MRQSWSGFGIRVRLALLVWLAVPGMLCAQAATPVTSQPADMITSAGVLLRLDKVEMDSVIDLYSRVTGRIVIPVPEAKGKVTVVNRERVSRAEAASLIEAALELQGWTIIPEGKVARLVKSRDAVKRQVPTVWATSEPALSQVSRMQTHLVTLHYAKAEDVKTTLAPLLSNDGNIIINPRTNLVILTEVGTNVSRLLELIEQIDRPLNSGEELVKRVVLKHVAPKKMLETVKDYLKDASLLFLPDERLQSLVVSGKPNEVARAVKIIHEIDLPVPPEQRLNQIVRIQYAKASEVSDLVVKLYKNRPDKPPESFSVNADTPSNSVILTGPPELREEICALIQRIDVRYQQVLLKVLIGEVATPEGGRSKVAGVEWSHLLGSDAKSELSQDWGAIGASAGKTNPGVGTVGLRYSLLRPGGYSAFVHLLEATSDFRTLASPQITVSNNKPAEFKVGRQVPVQTAERISDNSNTTVRSSEYRDVVLGFKATPQITPDAEVALHLDLEFNEQLGRDAVLNNPIFSTRQAKTDVIIHDQHTLVIGGLLRNDRQESNTRVPVLGRMPVIGNLFRSHSEDRPRQELLVLLTPTILRNPADEDAVTAKSKDTWFGAPSDDEYRDRFGTFDRALNEPVPKSCASKAVPPIQAPILPLPAVDRSAPSTRPASSTAVSQLLEGLRQKRALATPARL